MIVAIRKNENDEYIVVDNKTMEFKRVKGSKKKDSFYYSLLETDTHYVGIDNPDTKYMLVSIDMDKATIVNVENNDIERIDFEDLERRITTHDIGNIRHSDGKLELKSYTNDKILENIVEIRTDRVDDASVEIGGDTSGDFDYTDEEYLKHRVMKFILEHDRDYTRIKSVDVIDDRIYIAEVYDGNVEKELIKSDISSNNMSFELEQLERKHGY
jgi:hypothetical protein